MIIKKDHFNPTETQPFFRYWLLAIDAQIGDEIPVYEYLIWNCQQSVAFKKSLGEPANKPLCHIPNGLQQFGEFLQRLAELDQQQLILDI